MSGQLCWLTIVVIAYGSFVLHRLGRIERAIREGERK